MPKTSHIEFHKAYYHELTTVSQENVLPALYSIVNCTVWIDENKGNRETSYFKEGKKAPPLDYQKLRKERTAKLVESDILDSMGRSTSYKHFVSAAKKHVRPIFQSKH